MVFRLNLSPLAKNLTEVYKQRYPDVKEIEGFNPCDTLGEQGVVKTAQGYVGLNSEGVIDVKPISEENPLEINLYVSRKGSFSMLPWIGVRLPPSDVEPLISGDPVPLDKFIRTFGSRLESNFYICEDHLNKLNKPARKRKAVIA
jgi:hypothetical protein